MTGPLPTVRELLPAEWERLRPYEPFASHGLPDPASTRVLVVVTAADDIVGWWFLFTAWHAEPIWLDPAYRHSPAVGRRLLTAMRSLVQEVSASAVFAIIGETTAPAVAEAAARLGLSRLPGQLIGGSLRSS